MSDQPLDVAAIRERLIDLGGGFPDDVQAVENTTRDVHDLLAYVAEQQREIDRLRADAMLLERDFSDQVTLYRELLREVLAWAPSLSSPEFRQLLDRIARAVR